MRDAVNTRSCGQENDLIAFLYGELNDTEMGTFQRHLDDCPTCRAELTAFRDIRESVVTWRNESLGGVIAADLITESRVSGREKPSALAALRMFFDLSPLWLKGAVAFASLLFCLFAGLAVARRQGTPPAAVVTIPNQTYSEQQLNALVERRVQEELERIRNSSAPAPNAPVVANDTPQPNPDRKRVNRSTQLARNDQRPLSKVERQQLAADLRLVSAKNDSDLGLLDDGVNQ